MTMRQRRWYQRTKRLADVALALLAMVVLAPVMAVLAVVVRLQMGSPILFCQERPGRDQESFTVVKFRSMRNGPGTDADRLTPFGSWLRATSADELPELWNVLRGDMSLVGPRPLLTEYLPLYDERQARRHDVRPGLTGLAQVSGRNAVSWAERLELDVQYVEQQRWSTDLRILVRTVGLVVTRRGVAAPGEATMSRFEGEAVR